MSFELANPENRTAIDIKWPVTVLPESEWRPLTAALAQDCIDTAHLMASRMDEPLDDNYSINLVLKEPETDYLFAIAHKPEDLEDPEKLFAKYEPKVGMWLRLMPNDGSHDLRPVIIIDNDDQHTKLHTWDIPKKITLRGAEFTVRHQQSWKLWNYNAAKKQQGYDEEDYPGDLWQPEYIDQLTIVGGEYDGQDIFSLLCELDEAVESLQTGISDKSDWQLRLSDERLNISRKIRNTVRGEIAECSGINLHSATGFTAIDEAFKVLAAVRSFIKSD